MARIQKRTIDNGCDICGGQFRNHVFDIQTRDGRWAWACEECFKTHGIRLGTGFGQKYSTETLEKVEG